MKKLLPFLFVAAILLCGCTDPKTPESIPSKVIHQEESPLQDTPVVTSPVLDVTLEPDTSDPISIAFPEKADYYGIHETELTYYTLFPFDGYIPLVGYEASYAIYDSGIREINTASKLYQKYKNAGFTIPNVPDTNTTYTSVYGQGDYYDGYMVYGSSSKTDGYEKSVIYKLEDNSILCSLSLPHQKYENEDGSITENYCEIKHVASDSLVLLLFHKTVLLKNGSFGEYLSTLSIFNATDNSITNITGRVDNPIISKNGKWLMYTDVRSRVSYGSWMPSGVIFMNLETKNATYRDIDRTTLTTVGWVDKENFYQVIGENPPELQTDTILLNRVTDDMPVETIPVPDNFYYGNYIKPSVVDISDFDFGEYSPIIRKNDDEYDSYTHLILNEYTKSFEDGEKIIAELERYYCGENETIARFSDDMSDVIVSSEILSPMPNGSYNATKHIVYKDGKRVAVFFNDYEGAEKLLNDTADATSPTYQGAGDEIYRSDSVLIRALFNDIYIFDRNTKVPFALYKIDGDYSNDRYYNAKDGDLFIGSGSATDSVNDSCLLIEYERYVHDSSEGCGCNQRNLANKALYLYNTKDKKHTLVANHVQSYSLSPDKKYVAYSYAIPSTNEQNQEVFNGGIFIVNLENSETVMFPYAIIPDGYIWENICKIVGWTKYSVPTLSSQKPQEDVDTLTEIKVTESPDTPMIEPTAPEYIVNKSYVKPETVSHSDFVWGDFLPMVKYPSYQYAKYSCLDSFAIIGEGHSLLSQGEILYNKLNNKYLKNTPLPDMTLDTSEQPAVTDTFSRSRIIYASTDLDTVSTLTFIDKGANQPDYNGWLFRNRGAEYNVYQNGESVYSQQSDDVDIELLSTAGYYGPRDIRQYNYNLNGKVYKLHVNGKTYNDIYHDERYRVFNVDKTLFVYSIEKSKTIFKIRFPEPDISKKPYLTYELQQVVDDKTLLVKVSNLHHNSDGIHGTKNGIYLYNIEKDEYTHIANYAHNGLISPDGNYVIYTPYTEDDTRKHLSILPSALHKEECFYIKNLTDGTTVSFNAPYVNTYDGDKLSYFHVPAATLEPINWINKNKLEEQLASVN